SDEVSTLYAHRALIRAWSRGGGRDEAQRVRGSRQPTAGGRGSHGGGPKLAAQPRRPGHRPAPGSGGPSGHLGRVGRRGGRGAGTVRGGRGPAPPRTAAPGGSGALLRGPVQRHYLAAVPRRGGDPHLSAPVARVVPGGERPVRGGGGGGGRPRRHRLDPGLPVAARARHAPATAARSANWILPAHPVPAD